jgi:hypothetical protein
MIVVTPQSKNRVSVLFNQVGLRIMPQVALNSLNLKPDFHFGTLLSGVNGAFYGATQQAEMPIAAYLSKICGKVAGQSSSFFP